MIWLAIALGLACFVLYKVLIVWGVSDVELDELDEDAESERISTLAREIGLGPVLRSCAGCGESSLIDEGRTVRGRWLCVGCIEIDEALRPHGNVVRLDDRRRAS